MKGLNSNAASPFLERSRGDAFAFPSLPAAPSSGRPRAVGWLTSDATAWIEICRRAGRTNFFAAMQGGADK
jgi:hypothetical protein